MAERRPSGRDARGNLSWTETRGPEVQENSPRRRFQSDHRRDVRCKYDFRNRERERLRLQNRSVADTTDSQKVRLKASFNITASPRTIIPGR